MSDDGFPYRFRKGPVHHEGTGRSRAVIQFVTVCTLNRKCILDRDDIHALLIESWQRADAWKVGRYVVMPDHIHLFATPARYEAVDLVRWLGYWKSIVSRNWPRPAELKLWQRDYWDTVMRSRAHYEAKWKYVRDNPIRAGLVETIQDWRFQGELNIIPWD